MGSTLLEMGEFAAARVQFEQVLALYDPEHDGALAMQYTVDPRASSLGFLAIALWAAGYLDQAVGAREQAIKHAAELNHANTSGIVCFYSGVQLAELLGNMDDLRFHLQKLETLFRERMPFWSALGRIMTGWMLAVTGGPAEEGIALIREGISDKSMSHFHRAHYLSLLAAVQARVGNAQECLKALSRAKQEIADSGERLWLSDVLRIEGELRLRFGYPEKDSERKFVEAIEVARNQQARSFELRAATDLARLWQHQGNQTEARALLAPLYGWFTEGFDTVDLKTAEALLAELSA
jgi:predicted ATPase